MRTLLFVTALVAAVTFSSAYITDLNKKSECWKKQSRIYENQILQKIEEIRQQLKEEGLPGFGIASLDPLEIKDKRLYLNLENVLELDLNSTLHAEGLLGFNITNLKIRLIGLKFDFSVTFPVITASGSYGLSVKSPLVPMEVYGKGDLDVKATSLTIAGTGNLGTKFVDGKLKIIIKKAEVDILLNKFNLKITGLLGSEILSSAISEAISQSLPQILQDLRDDINEALKAGIEIINEWLESQDILGVYNAKSLYELC